MRYLEKKYRCNNIYTEYHSQLEGSNSLPSYVNTGYNLAEAVIVPEASAPSYNLT